MEFHHLKNGVWLTTVEPECVNVGLVVGPARALLVDSGTSPAQGTELRQAVARVTDRPLELVVLSHGHWDHAFGLAAFADCETIAHQAAAINQRDAEAQQAAAQLGLDWAGLPVAQITIASLAYRDLGYLPKPRPELTSVARSTPEQPWGVEIAHVGAAHTGGDLIIVVPSAGVVFAGDLIEMPAGPATEAATIPPPPQFDATSSLDGWVKALSALHGLLRPDWLVVPGHGRVATSWDVAHYGTGLAGYWGQAEWAFHQGIAEAEVYHHPELQWPWDEATSRRAISLAYAELRQQTEPQPRPGLQQRP